MKTRIISLLFLGSILAGGFGQSFDWGGKVENVTQCATMEGETLTQGDKITLWGKYLISSNTTLYADAGYLYRYENEETLHSPDFTALYLSGKNTRLLGGDYTLGRFQMRDSHGTVLDSVADGFRYTLSEAPFLFSFTAGYTGLVFIDNSNILMTPSDDYEKQDEDGILAPPRLIQALNMKYSGLSSGVVLTLSLVGQEDLRQESFIEDYTPGTGTFHSQYALAGAEGRIGSELFFSVEGGAQLGQYSIPEPSESYMVIAGMGKGLLEYYPSLPMKPRASLEMAYTSGDSWKDRGDYMGYSLGDTDNLYRFSPVSNSSKGFVYTLKTGNLMYSDFRVSAKPLESLQVELASITFFRAVDGPVSDGSIGEDAGGSLYLGEEIDLILNWRPLSDLGMSLSNGVFLPNGDIFEDKDVRFRSGAYVSFSF